MAGFEAANLGSRGVHVTRGPPRCFINKLSVTTSDLLGIVIVTKEGFAIPDSEKVKGADCQRPECENNTKLPAPRSELGIAFLLLKTTKLSGWSQSPVSSGKYSFI